MNDPKMGGKPTINLFLKGHDDLATYLLEEDRVNTQISESYNDRFQFNTVVESAATADLLWQSLTGIDLPTDLAVHGLDTPAIKAQFASQLVESDADIIALTIVPELTQASWRHNEQGYLLCPPANWQESWTPAQQAWFSENFTQNALASADAYKTKMTEVIQLLKEKTSAHLIMFGSSSFDPGDLTHNLANKEDTLTMRTHRLNLVMLELSFSQGLTFIDVDRLLAEEGCADHVLAAMQYTTQAHESICREFMHIIADIGFFEERPLLVQMGQRS
ncbi:MAG: hypothetical protein AAF490_01080 [Chloroflexota bacterium]